MLNDLNYDERIELWFLRFISVIAIAVATTLIVINNHNCCNTSNLDEPKVSIEKNVDNN